MSPPQSPERPTTHARRPRAVAAAAIVAAGLAGCQMADVSATFTAAPIGLEGSFGASSGGNVQTTSLDDLGVAGHDWGFVPRFDADWNGAHVSASALFTNRRGEGELSGTVELGGTTLTASTPVNAGVDLEVGTFAITWDVLPAESYELALGLGFHLVDFEAQIEDQLTGETASTDELFPVPVLAARFNLVDWPLGAGLTIGHLDIGLPGLELETFDLDAFIEWRAFGNGLRETSYLVLGYRRLDLFAEYDDVDDAVEAEFDLELITIGFRFDF